jgi:hypothetical protein
MNAESRGPWGITAAVLALGIAGSGAGFRNGDAACYAAQAWAGDLSERTIHLGYLAVAALLAKLAGPALPTALDLLSAVAAASAVLAVARIASRSGGSAVVAALVAAAVVLPEASYAEVDVVWLALVAWAAAVEDPRASAVFVGLAVTVSPTALLAVPFVLAVRREWMPGLGALVAVIALTLVSRGDWWAGDRGVLGASLDPGRTVGMWAWQAAQWAGPVAMLVSARPRDRWIVAAAVPLVLVPSDVPGWMVPGLALAIAAANAELPERVRGAFALAGAATLAWSVVTWWDQGVRIRAENAAIAAVAANLQPRDGVIAPWSWGTRLSVVVTGAPYAAWWRVPGPAVRDQERWCEGEYSRVVLLPGTLAVEGWHEGPIHGREIGVCTPGGD